MLKDNMQELLSYFIGQPPRVIDNRYRELLAEYRDDVANPTSPAATYDVIYDAESDTPNVPTQPEEGDDGEDDKVTTPQLKK